MGASNMYKDVEILETSTGWTVTYTDNENATVDREHFEDLNDAFKGINDFYIEVK